MIVDAGIVTMSVACWAMCAFCLSVPFIGNLFVSAIVSFLGSYIIGIRAETKFWPICGVVVSLLVAAVAGRVWGRHEFVYYALLLVVMVVFAITALIRALEWQKGRPKLQRTSRA